MYPPALDVTQESVQGERERWVSREPVAGGLWEWGGGHYASLQSAGYVLMKHFIHVLGTKQDQATLISWDLCSWVGVHFLSDINQPQKETS